MKTNDRPINELMKDIADGKIQLPDFQRGWVWDDYRIQAIIASISNNYPVGAAMFLEYGNTNIRFKYRTVEGLDNAGIVPNELILDGQQRLTSIYSAMYSDKPVRTRTDKGKDLEQFYYLDINKCLSTSIDRIDAIVSVPKSKIITTNFGRDVVLDLSSKEKEFEQHMYPLNLVLNYTKGSQWQNAYYAHHNFNPDIMKKFIEFGEKITVPMMQYKIPVIILEKDTPKEAVCQVFENVNTGGVSLTVFELVTAIFAMDDFELRKDWEQRYSNSFSGDILSIVTATDFLTAITLLSSYKNGGTVSCKKKDVLNLTLDNYKKYADELTYGFIEAEKLLNEERIFVHRDLPYTTQLIPLAVISTLLGSKIHITTNKDKLKRWYWCGVLGELYGSANETRYVNDIVGLMDWIENGGSEPKTVNEAYFYPTRLLSLQSRQSAAYKGIMALMLKEHCKDFISGREMDFTVYKSDGVDIHHIFPKKYCEDMGYPSKKWNSIVNKTPISYSTNREIGGVAPSKYISKIEKAGKVASNILDDYLTTHKINPVLCRTDDFDAFIVDRAKQLLDAISKATGKQINGRDSDDVVNSFGGRL